jgi:hypothetical protein
VSKPLSKSVRLGVESLSDRLVPSVTFTEHPDTHSLNVVAASGQNNTITIRNDGDGNLRITADGVTRDFTGVESLFVNTGNGRDQVTYRQGTATQEADIVRSFDLRVDLGYMTSSNDFDRFTANVFGDVGQNRRFGLEVNGGAAADVIDLNLNDTDVATGATLDIDAEGLNGNDTITIDMDGELDGTLLLYAKGGHIYGGADNDTVAVNILLDAGSTGSVGGTNETVYGGAAVVWGDLGNDNLRFAIRHQTGSNAEVNAVLDGGFNLFDNDVGRHTTNVRTTFLEQDIVIQ